MFLHRSEKGGEEAMLSHLSILWKVQIELLEKGFLKNQGLMQIYGNHVLTFKTN